MLRYNVSEFLQTLYRAKKAVFAKAEWKEDFESNLFPIPINMFTFLISILSFRNVIRASRGVGTVHNVDKLIQQLQSFSKQCTSSDDEGKQLRLDQKNILSFALQIARGMSYLSDMKVY